MLRVRFYLTPKGRSPVWGFITSLPEPVRLEVVDALNLLDAGKVFGLPFGRSLAEIAPGLHELRFRDRAGPVRVVYFMRRREAIYILHAFRKKSRVIPHREIELIKKRLGEIQRWLGKK
jgi:phage-related protein